MNVFHMHTMPKNYSPLADGWRDLWRLVSNIGISQTQAAKQIRTFVKIMLRNYDISKNLSSHTKLEAFGHN